jgi:hypothetical protein
LFVDFTYYDSASNPNDHKSTLGYIFNVGFELVTWTCQKKCALALSLVEVEYRATISASQDAMWLRQILSKFGFQQQHTTTPVGQLKCHLARQRSISTSMQQTH